MSVPGWSVPVVDLEAILHKSESAVLRPGAESDDVYDVVVDAMVMSDTSGAHILCSC